jgi:hypothetical protein
MHAPPCCECALQVRLVPGSAAFLFDNVVLINWRIHQIRVAPGIDLFSDVDAVAGVPQPVVTVLHSTLVFGESRQAVAPHIRRPIQLMTMSCR